MAQIKAILTEPNQTLRTPASPVPLEIINTPEFQALCDDMVATMYAADGIGLAAPQIGESIRLLVVGKDALENKKDLVLINPEISNYSWKTAVDEEACLSVPGVVGQVERHKSIQVCGFGRDGQPIAFSAQDFFARVLQHEHDHLNGILFIDRAQNTRRIKGSHAL